jgi:hypothetical protein
MNTDRELLELAARAMGYTTNHRWNSERLEMDPPVISLVVHENGELVSTGWNPLRDDGPALRLAVKLDIWIHPGDGAEVVEAIGITAVRELAGDDRMAATRRSIVHAAAEIGRSMP